MEENTGNLSLHFYTRFKRALYAGYIVIVLVILFVTIWYAFQTRGNELSSAVDSADSLNRALSEHVLRTFSSVSVLIGEVAYSIVREGGISSISKSSVHEKLKHIQTLLPHLTAIEAYDSNLMLYASSRRYPIATMDGSQLSYISQHKNQKSSQLHIGLPWRTEDSNQWVLPLSYRITNADGSFSGVLNAIFLLETFESFYRDLILSPGQGIGILNSDEILLYRYPISPVLKPGTDLGKITPVIPEGEQIKKMDTIFLKSKHDGKNRMITYRVTDEFNLVLAIAQEQDQILSQWKNNLIALSSLVAGIIATLFVLLIITIRQIDRRSDNEKRYFEGESRYRSLVELAPIGIARYYGEVIEYANPEMARILGVETPNLLIGKSVADYLQSEDEEKLKSRLKKLSSQEGKVEPAYYRINRKDGAELMVESEAMSLKQGEQLLTHFIMRDTTVEHQAARAIKKLNETLEQKVYMRTLELEAAYHELESFSYSVSHDLRSPLRAIAGFSSVLQTEYGNQLDEDAAGLLNRIQAGAQRMGNLIEALLSLGRVSRQELKPGMVNITALSRDIVKEHNSDQSRVIEVDIEEGLQIRGDPALLRVLLENLISNAFKYTGKTVLPVIIIGQEKNSSKSKNGESVFFIKDNGAGFDMQFAGRLFQPFQRLHRNDEFEGTGIGLATVARIIRRHGGRIWAEGHLNQGACFSFVIPDGPATIF